jgi:mannose-6-phosphate isomerase-like protein (cupin superfamily)
MYVNLQDIIPEKICEGILRRTLLNSQDSKGRLSVVHHTLSEREVHFRGSKVEYQHYIISGCCLYKNKYFHGDTAIFVPGASRFGEISEHHIEHAGEGELRILTAIYQMQNSNFRWAKPRVKNLNETSPSITGMVANQLFTEEEHAIMGARRMHSIDLQTHSPRVLLPIHKNPEEFGYILRGNAEVTSGLDKYSVGPGSLVYTPEGEPHSILNVSETLPLQYVAFEFTEQDKSLSEMR